MVRGTRIAKAAGVLAAVAALLLPISSAGASGGPAASKSGSLVHYTIGQSIKISKRMEIFFLCTADCNIDATTTVRGPGFHQTEHQSGALSGNSPGGTFFEPNSTLLKSMRAKPGKFRVISGITATDPATGAVDMISGTFTIKR